MDIEELKDQIGMEEVLLHLGAEIQQIGWGDEAPVYCPFHPNRRTPAGSFNRLKQLYHCFGCEAGGDIIRVAQTHLGREGQPSSVNDACEWLEREFLS